MKKILCCVLVILIIVFVIMFFSKRSNDKQIFQPKPTINKSTTDEALTNEKYVEQLISKMTLDEKIFQMMFVTPESITGVGQVIQAGAGTENALKKYPVGGIIYFEPNIQNRKQVIEMISNTQKFSKIPLFIGVDEEGGRVSRLSNAGITKQPDMMSIGLTGDPQKAYEVGTQLGKDLLELGFNVNFAPVADVLVNSENSVIGNRAFGSDAQLVSKMVMQEVKGLQSNGVSAALKHFPGHGSTSTDSHQGYSSSSRTLSDLEACEFLPFKAGIEANVDFVMVAHITMTNAIKEKVPATLSKELITEQLKNEMGFKGIVITDSCHMGAITQHYTTEQMAVKAVEAGIDMILMPKDVSDAHSAIKNAVINGDITESRIDDSVKRILLTKVRRNLL